MTFSDMVNLNYNFSCVTEIISLAKMLATSKDYLKSRLRVEETLSGKRVCCSSVRTWFGIQHLHRNLSTETGPWGLVRDDLSSHSPVPAPVSRGWVESNTRGHLEVSGLCMCVQHTLGNTSFTLGCLGSWDPLPKWGVGSWGCGMAQSRSFCFKTLLYIPLLPQLPRDPVEVKHHTGRSRNFFLVL